MKRALLGLFLLCFTVIHSQNKVIDSLMNRLKVQKDDSSKVKTLNRLSKKFYEIGDMKSCRIYAVQSKNLAQKLSYHHGLANALTLVATIHRVNGNFDSALSEHKNALAIRQLSGDRVAQAISLSYMGSTYATMGDLANALECQKQSLKISQEEKSIKNVIYAMIGIAVIYNKQGKYAMALEQYFSVLKIMENSKQKGSMAQVLGSIGAIYEVQKDYDKALDYYIRSLKIYETEGALSNIPTQVSSIGNVYYGKKDYDRALEYYTRALKLAEEMDDKIIISSVMNNIGNVYCDKGNYTECLRFFYQSLHIREETDDKAGIAESLNNIGTALARQKKYDEALACCKKSLPISKAIGFIELAVETEKLMSDIYSAKKEGAKALEHYKAHIELRDSLFNEENSKKIVRSEMNYEFEKKEAAAKALQEKKDVIAQEEARIKELELSRSRYIALALGAVLLFSFVLGFVIIRQNKLRGEQKAMQLEQKLLRLQMNPHFIFNSLQAIQNFIKDKDAAKYLSSFGALTRGVLENSRMEAIPLNKEIALLGHYLQLQKLLHEDQFNYVLTVAPGLETETILVPPMLAQPFIENAIEHGMRDIENGGMIEISFSEKGSDLLFEIKDNGRGLSENSDKNHHSLATTITRERLELINKGKSHKAGFTITDAYPGHERKGVKVNFTIPV